MKKPSKELIEATANAVMQHFIPKDPAQLTFSFNFTIPPAFNYHAVYQKEPDGQWKVSAITVDESRD